VPAELRLRRGLAVVPVPAGLVVEGGRTRQLLTGAAATAVLPRLLPLLDGTHSTDDIAAAIGLTAAQVGQALTVLGKRGLLEPVRTVPGDDDAAPYLSRIGADTIGLAAARVAVRGAGPVADALRADLATAGVRLVDDAPTLVVDVAPAPGPDDVTVLPVRGSVVGPLLMPGSACRDCLADAEDRNADDRNADDRDADAGLVAGVVGAEVLAVLAGTGPVRTWRAALTVAADRVDRAVTLPRPGCPRCGLTAGGHRDVAEYAWLTQRPPPGMVTARPVVEGTDDIRDRALRKRHRDLASAPRLDLGDDPLGPALRRAASEAVDVYVVTPPRDVSGRPCAVFRYDDLAHELVAARADCPPYAEVVRGTDLQVIPAAVVVLVAAVGRLFGRYDIDAFRRAHLAVGTACAGFGPGVTWAQSWTGALAELLELRPEQEIVAAVAGVA
jgi:hypothetical protein